MANLKIYLDIRHVSVKTKEAGLKVTVFHHGRTAYIPLGVSLKPENWDVTTCAVVKHPRRKTLNEEIKTKVAEYQLALTQLVAKYDVDTLSVNELKDMLVDWKNSDKIRIDDNCVMSVFGRFMEHKTGRTKNLYECTEKKIRAFLGKEADRLRFEQVNVEWLHRFGGGRAADGPGGGGGGGGGGGYSHAQFPCNLQLCDRQRDNYKLSIPSLQNQGRTYTQTQL